ncbi:hypothetical protein Tco_1099656, partial [Tanacetum coccineum]
MVIGYHLKSRNHFPKKIIRPYVWVTPIPPWIKVFVLVLGTDQELRSMCFLLADLNLKVVLGIGEQCEGLLGHPADPVLNDYEVEQNDSANVFKDVNHINFFDIEYPEIPNDDERVANDLNKNKSNSSSSSVSGSNINTADVPIDNSRNDADSSDELVA